MSLEIQVVIDRHGDTGACKPAAHTDITVHEPGPLDADIGTGRETQIQVADGRDMPVRPTETRIETEKRGFTSVVEFRIILLGPAQSAILVDQVGQKIPQLGRQDADPGPHQHIREPVLVIHLASHADARRYGVPPDTVPRAPRKAVFLMQHRRSHKSRRGMPRRKRIVARTVGTGLVHGIFEAIDHQRHQSGGKRVRNQHPPPRTAALHARDFQPEHQCHGSVLQVIVEIVAERRHIRVAQVAEMVALAIDGNAGYHQRHGDISHFIGPGSGHAVDPGTELIPTGKPDGRVGPHGIDLRNTGPGCMLHPVRHAGILGCRTRQRNIRHSVPQRVLHRGIRRIAGNANGETAWRGFGGIQRGHTFFCHRVRNDGRQSTHRKNSAQQHYGYSYG